MSKSRMNQPTSQNPEAGSPNESMTEVLGQAGGSSDRFLERRRVPRVSVSGELFRLKSNGKIFAVSDLSMTGMAVRLIDQQDLNLFPVGAHAQGTLNLEGRKIEVSGRVRRLEGQIVGLEFEKASDELNSVLKGFLDPAALGKSLKPLPADGNLVWYHGHSGLDVLLWRANDGSFQKFLILCFGSYAQWDEMAGVPVTTGMARHDLRPMEVHGLVSLESLILAEDPLLNGETLERARKIISHSVIPEDLKARMIRKLVSNH